MSATATTMHDFILTLERETPRRLHPSTDVALDVELRTIARSLGAL
jgi:hypothetical protein